MFGEELPRAKKSSEFPRNLVDMSIGELEEYIEELQVEIERAQGDIVKKNASRDAAASVFK